MRRLDLFRWVALIEGITTLALFCVAMPLKYGFDNPALVPPVGLIHGIAWIGYILAMATCLPRNGFGALDSLRVFVAGLFPFGTFLNDPFIRRKQAARAALAQAPATA